MLSPPGPRGQGRSWPEKESPSGAFRGADVKGSGPKSSPEAQPALGGCCRAGQAPSAAAPEEDRQQQHGGLCAPQVPCQSPSLVAGGRAASGAAATRPGCAAAAGRALLSPLPPWCVLPRSHRAGALRALEVNGFTSRPLPRSPSPFCTGIPGLWFTFQNERDATTAHFRVHERVY